MNLALAEDLWKQEQKLCGTALSPNDATERVSPACQNNRFCLLNSDSYSDFFLVGLRLRNMRAAILLPALFVVLGADRFILAEADGRQLVARQAQAGQILLGLFGARIAQREIVLFRSALVAVSLHRQLEVRILLDDVGQRLRVRLQSGFGVRTQRVLVVIEIGILDAVQQILDTGARGGVRQVGPRVFEATCDGCE